MNFLRSTGYSCLPSAAESNMHWNPVSGNSLLEAACNSSEGLGASCQALHFRTSDSARLRKREAKPSDDQLPANSFCCYLPPSSSAHPFTRTSCLKKCSFFRRNSPV